MTNHAPKPTLDPRGRPPRGGFTLIELMIVMTIIGIIVSFILIASRDGLRQADLRATQALVMKLEGGLNDRLDALMQLRPDPNFTHGYLAGIYFGGGADLDGGPLMSPRALVAGTGVPNTAVRATGRAQAIALADYLKCELPDVFVLNQGATTGAATYPLNFAARAFPGKPADSSLPGLTANFILPLGHMVQGPRRADGVSASGYGDGSLNGAFFISSNPQLGLTGRGIYGASYAAAAGVYKNLGYLPQGYDMVDNNGNGLIDEWAEGVDSGNQELVTGRLLNHTHETARSEMLYAILVEGQGPLGAVFNADEFSDREVQDTDGDGLPEFVDAWGKPLQFFRWPTLYHSDAQRGQNVGTDLDSGSASTPMTLFPPYASNFERREQDPLDPNQTLMAPAWWLASQNSAYPTSDLMGGSSTNPGTGSSGGVATFEGFFYRLTEPMEYTAPSAANVNRYWDRGGLTGLGYRRAFFTRPLILSGGPDGEPGVYISSAPTVSDVLDVENAAAQFVPSELMSGGYIPSGSFILSPGSDSFLLHDAGLDDITNHNVVGVGGSGG